VAALRHLGHEIARNTVKRILDNGLEPAPKRGRKVNWKTFINSHLGEIAGADFSAFRAMLKDAGVTPLVLPARSPNLNAHAERFALSVKSECLRKLVPLRERHLRYAIQQFAAHYHHERHHQGLAGQRVVPDEPAGSIDGSVVRQKRLRGLLNFYCREAA
jgi:hypothetical protein